MGDSSSDSLNKAIRFPRFSMALQPIVSLRSKEVFAYEALCRGERGENYPELAARFHARLVGSFDRLCTASALKLAAMLGVTGTGVKISLNMRPSNDDASLNVRYVERAAQHYGIAADAILLELTEDTRISCDDLHCILKKHHTAGMATAIDDFGAGYSGLNLLASCHPEIVKIDRALIHGIDTSEVRQTIVHGFVDVCRKLGSEVIAEGVETREECETLQRMGIDLMQGYLFARPMVGCAPVPRMDFAPEAMKMPAMIPEMVF